MNACQTLDKPEAAKHHIPGKNDPRKCWNPGLRLDAVANLAVLCAGVAIVMLAAATDGQLVLLTLTA